MQHHASALGAHNITDILTWRLSNEYSEGAHLQVTYLSWGFDDQEDRILWRRGLALHFAWPPPAAAQRVGRRSNF